MRLVVLKRKGEIFRELFPDAIFHRIDCRWLHVHGTGYFFRGMTFQKKLQILFNCRKRFYGRFKDGIQIDGRCFLLGILTVCLFPMVKVQAYRDKDGESHGKA